MFRMMFNNIPPVVKNLLIINVLFFLFKLALPEIAEQLALYNFKSPFFQPFQLVTHAFMHGDGWHLLFNMFGLIFAGSAMENIWGPKRFLAFYFICFIGAILVHQFVNHLEYIELSSKFNAEHLNSFLQGQNVNFSAIENQYVPELNYYAIQRTVGASGAVYGLFAAFALLFPNVQIQLLFPPIPIKAKYLVGFLIVMGVFNVIHPNPEDNTAHFAHLGGALTAFLLIKVFKKY